MKLESYQKDQAVYQIDSFSQKFYIILEGKVGVFTKIKEQGDLSESCDSLEYKSIEKSPIKKSKKTIQCIKELEPGVSFGELDINDDRPKSETIICNSDCCFAVLNKREFQTIIRQYEEDKLLKEMGFFAQLPIFQGWYFGRIKSVYQNATQMNFKKNSIVFKEGQPCKYVYIIDSGEFVAKMSFNQNASQNNLINEEDDDQQQNFKNEYKQKKLLKISVLSHPEMFGEEDILRQQNRSYSVVCESSEGSLIAIDKEDFMNKIMEDINSSQFIMQRLQNKSTNSANRKQNIENLLSQYCNFVIDEKATKTKEKERSSFSNKINNNQRRSTYITYSQNNSFLLSDKQNEVIPKRQNSPSKQRIELGEQKTEVILPKNEYFLQEIQQFNQFGYNESFEEENPHIPTSPIRDRKKKRTINITQLQRHGSINLLDDRDNSDNQLEQASPLLPHKSQSQYNLSQSSSFINLQSASNQLQQEKFIYKLKENYQSSLQQQLALEKAMSQQQVSLSPKRQRIKEEIRKDPLSDGFKKQLQIRFFNQFGEINLKSLQEHIPQQIVQDTPKNINEQSLAQFKTDLLKNNKVVIPYAGKSGVRNYLRDMQNKVDKKLKKEIANTPQSQNKDAEEVKESTQVPQRSKSVFFDRSKRKSINPNTNVLLSKVMANPSNIESKLQNSLDQKYYKIIPASKQDSFESQLSQHFNQTPQSITKSQINSRKSSLNDTSNIQKQINISTFQEYKVKKQDISPLKLGSSSRNVFKTLQSIKNNSPLVIPIHSNIQQNNKRDISPLMSKFKAPEHLPLTKNTIINKMNLLQEYQNFNYQGTQQHILIKNISALQNTQNNQQLVNNQNQSNNQIYQVQSFTDCIDDLKINRNKSSSNIAKIQTTNITDNSSPTKVSPNISPSRRKNIQQIPTYKFQVVQQKQIKSLRNLDLANTQQNFENNFIVQSKLQPLSQGDLDQLNSINSSYNIQERQKNKVLQSQSYTSNNFFKQI